MNIRVGRRKIEKIGVDGGEDIGNIGLKENIRK